MSNDVLINVEGVSKKFCRSLKKSLWYGLKDIANEALGRNDSHDQLRAEEFWAVNDIAFELRRGECLGLIGRNGAGKTTLLRMLNGLIKPDKGRIEMRGRVGALIALGAGFNPILTGRENIYVNASVLGLSKKETAARFGEIVEFAELGEFIDTPVQSYSTGMSVRLGFAVAAMLEPDILLLDEVLAVGDMAFQRKCFAKLERIRQSGTCLILVSHQLTNVRAICERTIWLQDGRIAEAGRTDNVLRTYTNAVNREKVGMNDGPGAGNGGRFGSGEVKVSAVTLQPSQKGITILHTGQDIAVDILFEKLKPVAGLRFWVALCDRKGAKLAGAVSPPGNAESASGVSSVRCLFKSLPLLSGEYSIYVGILDKKITTTPYDRVADAARFAIDQPDREDDRPYCNPDYMGVVKIESEWFFGSAMGVADV